MTKVNKMKAFVSWSGGKETSLACYRALKGENINVAYLLNMISEDGKHSRSHGVSSKLLKIQAEAIGIPIIQRGAAWGNYEEEFKKAVSRLKKENVQAGVFGDIDVQEHRGWVERVCGEAGVKPVLPLWKGEREELLKEFIQAGFRAIIVATQPDLLGKEWLGRQINREFMKDLNGLGSVDLCGENGEYHTFVYDGPIFKRPVGFKTGRKMLKDDHWFLELKLEKDCLSPTR